MADVIDMSGKPIIPSNNDDMHEYVCEHCGFGRFKDTGPYGECRLNPPTAGVILVPVKNALGMMEPSMQPYSVFPSVERRMYCYQFEDKVPEGDTGG